ncbi:MAG TPA: DUF5069 domain-containing protein [Stenomitos sp.]
MIQAKDLSKDVPRSPFEELDGYPWLPRLIDKARAMYAGTNGDYTDYPCPGDKIFLKAFQIDSEPLGSVIKSGADDAAIVKHVKSHSQWSQKTYDDFLASLHEPPRIPLMRLAFGLFLRMQIGKYLKTHPGADVSKVNTLAKFLVVEEGHSFPTPRR